MVFVRDESSKLLISTFASADAIYILLSAVMQADDSSIVCEDIDGIAAREDETPYILTKPQLKKPKLRSTTSRPLPKRQNVSRDVKRNAPTGKENDYENDRYQQTQTSTISPFLINERQASPFRRICSITSTLKKEEVRREMISNQLSIRNENRKEMNNLRAIRYLSCP
jgi:hypothetical protein